MNGEIFYSLKEAKTVIENWRIHYNTRQMHSALGHPHGSPSYLGSTRPGHQYELVFQRVWYKISVRLVLAEVVQVARFGPDALNLVFRVNGRVGERLAYRGEEVSFEAIEAGWSYA